MMKLQKTEKENDLKETLDVGEKLLMLEKKWQR